LNVLRNSVEIQMKLKKKIDDYVLTLE